MRSLSLHSWLKLWPTPLLILSLPALAASPSNHLERLEALQAAFAAGEHQKVIDLASRIVAENPDRADAWNLLGRHAESPKRYALVISASRQAPEEVPLKGGDCPIVRKQRPPATLGDNVPGSAAQMQVRKSR